MSRDQKFFDMYSLVIGVLAVGALAIFVLAMKISDRTQGVYTREGDEYQAAVAERIRPFGEVYLPGEEQAAAGPTVAAAEEPAPVEAALSGPQVYNTACLACHGAGIGGAPILGEIPTGFPEFIMPTFSADSFAIVLEAAEGTAQDLAFRRHPLIPMLGDGVPWLWRAVGSVEDVHEIRCRGIEAELHRPIVERPDPDA